MLFHLCICHLVVDVGLKADGVSSGGNGRQRRIVITHGLREKRDFRQSTIAPEERRRKIVRLKRDKV